MAQMDVASDEGAPAQADNAPDRSPEPTTAPDAPSGGRPNEPQTARMTLAQHAQRSVLVLVTALVCALLFAPIVVAVAVSLWALVMEALSVLSIEQLIRHDALLQTGPAMSALSVASRIGFVAVGYLSLFCALMALLAGLLGRGRGRLFIIPGALLTASALIFFATSLVLSAPLLESLHAPQPVWVVGALYLAIDTVVLATLLADTRDTRRQWLRRRSARAKRRQPGGKRPSPPANMAGA